MSAGEGDCEAGDIMTSCCASCGIAEADEVKLKECANCYLVKYCSGECQENHASQHEEACKKRAVELRDELLFKQPKSTHLEDCPICCLPLPLDLPKSTMHYCCSKVVCLGCDYANDFRIYEGGGKLEHRCPFCREPVPSKIEECDKQRMKRIEANDPVALCEEGFNQYVKADYSSAFEYYTRAAELGDAEAHNSCYWWASVKHYIISANLGDDESIKLLIGYFKQGFVSKEELTAVLRAHQAAVDATKSPQREAAEEYRRKMKSSK
eukprot:scaffold8554_cov91-Skeletonema_dohrnii-CCMP3373.AAC.3